MGTAAGPGSHDELVAQMAVVMGREPATQLDMMAQMHMYLLATPEPPPDAEVAFQAVIADLTAAMGAEFAQLYERRLRQKIDAELAAQAAQLQHGQALLARAEAGEPLVSEQELATFLHAGGADKVLDQLNPSVLEGLEQELGQLDLEKLPDGDLGKHLASALRKKKTNKST